MLGAWSGSPLSYVGPPEWGGPADVGQEKLRKRWNFRQKPIDLFRKSQYNKVDLSNHRRHPYKNNTKNEVSPITVTERLPRETGRSYAYRVIRENIISTELAPGSLVSEKELAQQMNLSRTPVREALIDLSQVGIVEVMPQRGSRISYIDSHMVEEAQFMRDTLERGVCQRLCAMEMQPDLTPLLENLQAQEAAFRAGENETFFRLDNQFHRLFFQLAGMLHIYQLSCNFLTHFDRLRSLSLSVQDNGQLIAEHREMVDCLRRRDASGVDQAVDRHLHRYIIDAAVIRRTHPAFFQEGDL